MKTYIGKYVMTALSAAVLAAGTLLVSAQYRVSPQTGELRWTETLSTL